MQEPDIDIYCADYRELFAQYTITMIGAQRMEAILKLFLLLANVLEKHAYNAMTDEYIEELITNLNHGTLTRIVNSINHYCRERNINIMGEGARETLERLTKLRNYLAHSYLTDNFSFFENAETRGLLITELKCYTEEFDVFEQKFRPLTEVFIEELKRRGAWDGERDYATIKSIKLEALKSRLKINLGLEE